jgi:hypothetical protein
MGSSQWAEKAYVAADSPSLLAILAAAHGMGHEGTKTLHRLRRDFFVLGARAAVKDHVQACVICQLNKIEHLHLASLLQPLEVPSTVWSPLAMDFMEGFPQMNGKSVVMWIVSRSTLTSYPWAILTQPPQSPRCSLMPLFAFTACQNPF